MNKKTNIIVVIITVLIVVGLIIRMEKLSDRNQFFRTESPYISDIENKILIPGNVYPNIEVEVKSSISGILEELYVEIGQEVNAGDDVAKVKLMPTPIQVESARNNLNVALVEFRNAEIEYNRTLQLYTNKVIARADFEKVQRQFDLARQQYQTAQNQMNILVGGNSNTTGISNVIKAPISGTVIELPLEEGASVIERNNFNVGTSLAVIAQMDYFLFRGRVNEMDLVKLHNGMSLAISLNVLTDKKTEATIEKIYPRGVMEQGVMKYMIEAKFEVQNDLVNVRSGYTATAELILESRNNVLCINEKNLIFQNDSVFVDLVEGKTVTRKHIVTGISDGLKIEILDGLLISDKIKETP